MRFSCSSASLLIIFISALVQYSQQQCYNHDGGIMPHDIQCTEFASDSDSAVPCCEPGRSCLPNGMCSSSDTDSNLMQASCTDKSWESAHCPEFCNSKLNTTIFNCTAMTGMTKQANMNAYCCAESSPQCCDYQNLMFFATDLVVAVKPSSSSSSSLSSPSASSLITSTGSSATTSTAAGSQSAPDASTSTSIVASPQSVSHASSASSSSSGSSKSSSTSSSGLSTSSSSMSGSTTGQSGTKTEVLTASIPSIVVANPTTTQSSSPGPNRDWTGVGIGVGIGAAVPIIILLIVGLLLWRRHRRKLLSSEDGASSRLTKDPSIRMTRAAFLKAHEADGVPRYELETVRGAEADGVPRYELETVRGAEADGLSRYELETVRGAEMAVRSPRELPVRSPRELPGSERERYRHQAYRSGSLNNPAELD